MTAGRLLRLAQQHDRPCMFCRHSQERHLERKPGEEGYEPLAFFCREPDCSCMVPLAPWGVPGND